MVGAKDFTKTMMGFELVMSHCIVACRDFLESFLGVLNVVLYLRFSWSIAMCAHIVKAVSSTSAQVCAACMYFLRSCVVFRLGH